MTCDEFEGQLQEVLDQRRTPAADPFLGKHAKSCFPCQRKLQLYEALFDGLELAEAPSLGADFSQEISRVASVGRRSPWKVGLAASIAVAASLLVVVAINSGGGEPGAAESVANEASPTDPQAVPREDGSAPQQRVGESLAPTIALAGHAPRTASVETADLADRDASISQEPYEIISTFAKQNVDTTKVPGLRPFATSLTTGFSAIRQTLPGGRDEEAAPEKPQAGTQFNLDLRHA